MSLESLMEGLESLEGRIIIERCAIGFGDDEIKWAAAPGAVDRLQPAMNPLSGSEIGRQSRVCIGDKQTARVRLWQE